MEFKSKHRAVAPIIATLLMVAISVVGGILIFVFAQGFFTDSSIHAPSIDSIEVFGYDARDATTLRPHNFDPLGTTDAITGLQTLNIAAHVDGKLSNDDKIALYVRNKGAAAVTITKVTVFGTDYTLHTPAAACSTTVPAAGEYSVSVGGTLAACNTASAAVGVGQEATI